MTLPMPLCAHMRAHAPPCAPQALTKRHRDAGLEYSVTGTPVTDRHLVTHLLDAADMVCALHSACC